MSRISGLLGRQLQGKEGKEGKGFRCKSASVRNRAARFPRSYDPLDLPLLLCLTGLVLRSAPSVCLALLLCVRRPLVFVCVFRPLSRPSFYSVIHGFEPAEI